VVPQLHNTTREVTKDATTVAKEAERTGDDLLLRTLRMLSPGSVLQAGLENILRARTGGLIVVGDSPEVLALCNGGFRIDAETTPAALYELAKMDGAIILSHDSKRILLANTQLTPNAAIPTVETGTRHRTAERVARQTGELVISISQRRNVITIYRGAMRYVLRDVSVILTKANQALATLERYKNVLEQALSSLSALEFEDLATLFDVVTCIQRALMVQRIVREIERYVSELGLEGRLVSMQLEELMMNIQDEGYLVVKDYIVNDKANLAESVAESLEQWSSEELLDPSLVGRTLGLGTPTVNLDAPVTPRGYRVLHKIPRLPRMVIDNVVAEFKNLPDILNASTEDLDAVEGIGEVRARSIKEGLRRLREQVLLELHL
jgi:diadenylate cyclase